VSRRRLGAGLPVLLAAAALAACGATDRPEAADDSVPELTTTIVTIIGTTSTTTAEQAVALGECPALPTPAEPDPDRPRYEVTADVDPETGEVDGTVRVAFTPDLDVGRLVFRLWANGPRYAEAGTSIEVGEVTRAGGATLPSAQPDPTTLVVTVPGGLSAGETIEVAVPYHLVVGGPANDRISRSPGSMRLGSFLPTLSWEPGVGWATEPPTGQFAESATSPTADYSVSVSVPDGYDVLGTGAPGADGVWRGEAVRDFALSIGRFATVSAEVALPDPVTVVVGVHEGVPGSPQEYLDRVVGSLEFLALRFGAYPWDTFSLAITPDLSGGIEMPTHVMQGADTIGRTTPHEVAHQWFYGLVGNDQGRDPVLDEGLASYGEARYEDTLTLFQQRDVPDQAEGRLGEPMTFWDERQSAYYPGVYVQGAAAVASLGEVQWVDCALRHYVAANRYGIATPADLVEAMEVVWPDAATRLAPYGITP
jgi:hypothetical protein